MTLQRLAALAAMGLVPGVSAAAAPITDAKADALMKSGACFACHTVDKKLVGPSYKDVAARRKGDPTAVKKLEVAIRAGSKDVYGPVPMAPTPANRISDADLRALIEWILKR